MSFSVFLVTTWHFPWQVTKLMDRVEKTFTKHFYNSNRNKAMSILRPKAKRERHRVTFSTGKHQDIHVYIVLNLILW